MDGSSRLHVDRAAYALYLRLEPGVTRLITNLFTDLPSPSDEEVLSEILARPGVRIERIVSFGQASPVGFWYDQPHGEWVLVLAGAACLRFESEPSARTLAPGDHVNIPPHCRHRVEWTDPVRPTVWLAVHYG